MAKPKEIPALSTPADLIKLNNAVEEAVAAHIRIADEKSFIGDVIERMEEELAFPASAFRALVSERYKEAKSKVLEQAEQIVDLNDQLLDAKRKQTQSQQG